MGGVGWVVFQRAAAAAFSPCLHKSVSRKQEHKRCKEALKTQWTLLESAADVHRRPETNGGTCPVEWKGAGLTCQLTEDKSDR